MAAVIIILPAAVHNWIWLPTCIHAVKMSNTFVAINVNYVWYFVHDRMSVHVHNYSGTSDSGPSEIGTLYNKPPKNYVYIENLRKRTTSL